MVIFTVIAAVLLGNKAAPIKIPLRRYTPLYEGARRGPARRVLRARPPAPRRGLAGGVPRARRVRAGSDGRLRRAVRRRARPAREARRDLGADAHRAAPRRGRRRARADRERRLSYRVLRSVRDAQRRSPLDRRRGFGDERRSRSEEHTLNSSHLVISYAVFC